MFEFFFLRQRQMADAKSTATSSSKCPAFLSRYLQQISLAASFSKFFTLESELSFAVWISSAIISFCSKEEDALVKAKWTQAFIFVWISENQYCCVFVIGVPQCLVYRLKTFNNVCSCNWLKCLLSQERRRSVAFSACVQCQIPQSRASSSWLVLIYMGMQKSQHCVEQHSYTGLYNTR